MRGAISEGGVPTILRDVYLHRRTGLLHFTKPGAHRTVRFIKGCIVGADTDMIERSLGEELAREGLLNEEDLKRARATVVATGRSLGAVLQDLRLVERGRFEDVAALHAREILLDVFSWNAGTFRFEEQSVEQAEDGNVTLKLSTGEIILEAVRSVGSATAIRAALGDLNRVLVPSTDPLLRFQRITLTPTDGFVLSRVDGTLTAEQIVEIAPRPASEVEQSLLGLLCTGIIEFLPAAPERKEAPAPRAKPPGGGNVEALRRQIISAAAQLQSRNHFEVLGMPVTASAAEIKAAYFRLARKFHPDAHHDPALADLRDPLERTFTRINKAFDTLSDPERRAAYESFIARQEAPPPVREEPPAREASAEVVERALQDAEQLWSEGKHWEVVGLIHGALPQARGRVRQRMRILRAQVFLKYPERVRQVIDELQDVVAEDPQDAQAQYLLGVAFRIAGLKKRAAGHFKKTLELRPQHREARMELEALDESAE
ncbi:MAG: DnaJ domain-containing protein [Vicinamibacteria bacterium]|nr:DnaJ domain-containing protein [Vicinamibacteria bacterium]